MKKLIILATIALALTANAGSYVVSVQMADGSIRTIEMASVPNPDSNGMYTLHDKVRGNNITVHCSHVWIEEKTKKTKAKAR